MNPLVSIIIPAYNRAHLIAETLDSVLAQTYQNWECIIIDDFSTDSTFQILEEYNKKDKRFIICEKSPHDKKSASSSRNIGLQKAKGDYIQFLDSDDLIASNKLEEQLQVLSNGDKQNILTCKWGIFKNREEDGNVYEQNLFYRDFENALEYLDLVGEYGGFFPLHCFLIPKKIIEKTGNWDDDLTLNDDGEFIFRALIHTDKILFCSKTYVLYRKNDSESLSTITSNDKIESLIASWKKIESHYFDAFGFGSSKFLNKKKGQVYDSIKYSYPQLIKKNRLFFIQEIQADDDKYNFKHYYKKFKNKIKFYLAKYSII